MASSRTHQVECFTIWFDFMLLHVLYKAAVCVSKKDKEQLFIMKKYPTITLLGNFTLLSVWDTFSSKHLRVPPKVFH